MQPAPNLLKFQAFSEPDVEILSALLQDAICLQSSIIFKNGMLTFLLQRYCREHDQSDSISHPLIDNEANLSNQDNIQTFNVNHGLIFSGVQKVKHRALQLVNNEFYRNHYNELKQNAAVLNLLCIQIIAPENSVANELKERPNSNYLINIIFSGGYEIALELDKISIYSADIGAPWPSIKAPKHHFI